MKKNYRNLIICFAISSALLTGCGGTSASSGSAAASASEAAAVTETTSAQTAEAAVTAVPTLSADMDAASGADAAADADTAPSETTPSGNTIDVVDYTAYIISPAGVLVHSADNDTDDTNVINTCGLNTAVHVTGNAVANGQLTGWVRIDALESATGKACQGYIQSQYLGATPAAVEVTDAVASDAAATNDASNIYDDYNS